MQVTLKDEQEQLVMIDLSKANLLFSEDTRCLDRSFSSIVDFYKAGDRFIRVAYNPRGFFQSFKRVSRNDGISTVWFVKPADLYSGMRKFFSHDICVSELGLEVVNLPS